MLEALIIYYLGRGVGQLAEDKGHSGGLFTALFVGVWFIGELGGILLGVSLLGAGSLGPAYLLGLLAAGGGAVFVFLLALALPSSQSSSWREDEFDLYGRPRRPRRTWAGAPRKRRRPVAEDADEEPRPRSGRRKEPVYEVQEEAPVARRRKPRAYRVD